MMNFIMRSLRKERIRRNAVYFAVIGFLSLILMILLITNKESENSAVVDNSFRAFSNNRWIDISIPAYGDENNKNFRYSDLLKTIQNECLPRAKFAHELARSIKIDPYSNTENKPYTLVFGGNTAVGQALISELKKNNQPYLNFKGIVDYEATAILDVIPKDMVNVSKAIICVQIPKIRSVSKPYKYDIKRITYMAKVYSEYFTRARIPYIIVMQPPYAVNFVQLAEWFERPLIFVPFLTASNDEDDLENPFVRAAKQCKAYGKATIDQFSDYPVVNIPPQIIAKYILNRPIEDKKDTIQIVAKDSMTVSDILNEALPDCDITYTNNYTMELSRIISVNSEELKSKSNIVQSVAETIKNIQHKKESNNPYLSIVLAVSSQEVKYVRRFLYMLNRAAGIVPFAKFEIIIVNYRNGDQFINNLNIENNLKGKVRIISINDENHNNYIKANSMKNVTFLKNLARNVGIKRAKGDFISVVNPDILLPTMLLEYVADHSFNDGVLYRSNRMDFRSSYAQKLSDDSIFSLLNSPWEFADNSDIAPHCFYEYDGPMIMSKESDIRKYILCSTSDFVLASRNMWDAINGLPEFGGSHDPDGDILASFMRLAPGIVMNYLRDPIIHLNEESESEVPPLGIESIYRKEMICSGKSHVTNTESKGYGIFNIELPEQFI